MARCVSPRLLSVCALLLGCADLPVIPIGVCGNGVAEPDNGEDCDGTAPSGATCGAPSSPQACRYVCNPEVEGGCPERFACGTDGLCRAFSSTFRNAPAATFHGEETPLDIVVADADGDRRADVFEQGPRSVVVHYDVTRSTDTLAVARDPLLPVVGPVADLSGDNRADAVIPVAIGYFVSLGDETRVERATAYGAIPLPEGATHVQALAAEVLPDMPGSELLVLTMLAQPGQPGVPVIVDVGTNGVFAFIGVLPDDPRKLAGPVRPGRLNEDDSVVACDELVLAYENAPTLDLLVPCARSPEGKTVFAQDAPTTPVRLPAGVGIAGPVEIEDLDRDGHLDLVVIAARGDKNEIDVAYGRGDGTFDPAPTVAPSTPATGSAGTAVLVGDAKPLAVFDLDGDGRPDWVDATGIHLSRAPGPELAGASEGALWTTALIDQFNGDQLPDVAVGSDSAPGLTLFLNVGGGVFTAFPIATRGNPTLLDAGDFDGDRIRDLALVTNTPGREATSPGGKSDPFDTLSVVFGAPFGAPSAPKSIGEFRHIDLVASARISSGQFSVVDGADDLGALAEDDEGTLAFAVALGQGNRDLRAPYGLTRTDQNESSVEGYAPVRLAVGDADGDGHPDVLSYAVRIDQIAGAVLEPNSEQRLWSTPMTGEASIQLGRSTVSEAINPGFAWGKVLFGAVDLDGAPGDELVVMGPRNGGSGYQSAIARASHTGTAAPTYSLGNPVPLEGLFERSETPLSDPLKYNGRLRTADVDGDGAADVLVLRQQGNRGELVVYFNDHTGGLGTPSLVANSDKLDVRDFATAPVPGSPKSQIVMLAGSSVYAVTARGRELRVGDAPALNVAPSIPMLISTGDMDGDGVEDVALAGRAGIEVHLGVSANSKDAR